MDGPYNKESCGRLEDCWAQYVAQTNERPEKAEDQVSEKGIVVTFPSWIGEAKRLEVHWKDIDFSIL